MKLTEAAAQRIAELTKRADSEIVVCGRDQERRLRRAILYGRIRPRHPAHDEVVEDKASRSWSIQGGLVPARHRDGLQADKMQSQFIFNNPNQTGACGCGESVQLTAGRRMARRTADLDGSRFLIDLFRNSARHDPPDVFRLRHFSRRHQLCAGAARRPVFPRRRSDIRNSRRKAQHPFSIKPGQDVTVGSYGNCRRGYSTIPRIGGWARRRSQRRSARR